MPLRMAITKVSGQGEQLVVDVCQWNPVTGEIEHATIDEMSALFNQALQLADIRLYEMNMRTLEARGLKQYFLPEIWSRITCIFDIISGQVDVQTVVNRWQSEKEETEALEQGRIKAALTHLRPISNAELSNSQEPICTCAYDIDSPTRTVDPDCPIHGYASLQSRGTGK